MCQKDEGKKVVGERVRKMKEKRSQRTCQKDEGKKESKNVSER